MSIVYILKNRSMPDHIKIGICKGATKKALAKRIRDLDTTGLPYPFDCYYAVRVTSASKARAIEKLLHKAFDDKRVKLGKRTREFFELDAEPVRYALKIAEEMGGKNYTMTSSQLKVQRSKAKKIVRANETKGKNIDYFGDLGIKPGSILTFSKDKKIKCKTMKGGKVIFDGVKTTVSGSAKIVMAKMGYGWERIRGADYWCHKGVTLSKRHKKKF